MVVGLGRRRVKIEECTSNKGKYKPQKISVGPIRKAISYIGNLLACSGIDLSLLPLTTSSKGLRLLLFDLLAPPRGRRTIEDTGKQKRYKEAEKLGLEVTEIRKKGTW
jgi:hypothetical protein